MKCCEYGPWHLTKYVTNTVVQYSTANRTIVSSNLSSGLYYKHTTIVNYASSVVNKLKALLTDDARVVIYDLHVIMVQATVVTRQQEKMANKRIFCSFVQ
jgi:ribosomal protein S3AE